MTPFLQRPKKSKLSGWQILTRKNFLDGALKSFSWQIHCFGDIYINTFLQEFMYRNWLICFQIIWKVSKPSGKFSDHPESFQTIRKVSRPSWKFSDHPESFQIIRKVSRPSGKFLGHPESFQTIRKVSRSSGKFPDHPKVSKSSGKFPDNPESFQTIRKVYRSSRNMCILACF